MNKKIKSILAILTLLLSINSLNLEAKEIRNNEIENSEIELVFVLDTTSSMSGLIEAAKEKIWSIATTFSSVKPAPKIKIGLVGFRDKGDEYITKVIPLSENIDEIYTKLMSFQAQGGGDGPESVNQALHEAITNINWSKNKYVYKVLFLVGDAPPHMDYQDDVKYQKSIPIAIEKDIIVNAIQCGSQYDTVPIWKEIAKLGGGDYFQVAQSGNAILYDTPYDKEIAELSRELDQTKVYYGSTLDLLQAEEKNKEVDEIKDKASYSAQAKRAFFNSSKAGKKNFLWGKDLVDDWKSGGIELSDIDKNHFPNELSKMNSKEKKKYLSEKFEKREKIQNKINQLSQKRQDYISELVKKEKDQGRSSLDHKIFDSLRSQSKEKGILLEKYQY